MDRRFTSTWWTLKIALGLAPLLSGLDKFFNLLTNWTDYLNPRALELVPVDAEVFMRGVGVIEMIVGLALLTRWTRLGAYLAACWLVAEGWSATAAIAEVRRARSPRAVETAAQADFVALYEASR